MTANELIEEVDNATILIIREKLANGQISDKRAKEIAAYVLQELQPSMSLTELYKKVSQFDDNFPELKKVVIDITEKFETIIREDALSQVHTLLQKKDITSAINTLDTALKDENKMGDTISIPLTNYVDSAASVSHPERILNEIMKQ